MPPKKRAANSKTTLASAFAHPGRAQRKTPATAGRAVVKNARKVSAAERARQGTRALNAFADELVERNGPVGIPMTWVSFMIGVLLIPLVLVTLQTFFRELAQVTVNHEFWRTAQFWFFHVGVALWIVVLAGLRGPKMIWMYVFGHEYTHALFAIAFGGKILKIPRVTSRGGEVITTKNNVLISLSPYFVPFYSAVAGGVYWILQWFFEFGPIHDRAFFTVIGFTWAFHLTFTFLMVIRSQPDLEQYGTFFSLVMIALVNLLVVSALFVIGSPTIDWRGFWLEWWVSVQGFWRWFLAGGAWFLDGIRSLLSQ